MSTLPRCNSHCTFVSCPHHTTAEDHPACTRPLCREHSQRNCCCTCSRHMCWLRSRWRRSKRHRSSCRERSCCSRCCTCSPGRCWLRNRSGRSRRLPCTCRRSSMDQCLRQRTAYRCCSTVRCSALRCRMRRTCSRLDCMLLAGGCYSRSNTCTCCCSGSPECRVPGSRKRSASRRHRTYHQESSTTHNSPCVMFHNCHHQ